MAKVFLNRNSILGIDIGSVSLYIVQMEPDGNISHRYCQPHKGNIRAAFLEAGKIFDLPHIRCYCMHLFVSFYKQESGSSL